MITTVPYIQTALAQTLPGATTPPPGGGAVPPSGGGAITPPSGATTTPPGAVPPGVGTIPPGTTTIPSNNVTALHVYDNSTMVLEFGNGTTLASPYSKVWRISFSPASNQTIGNIPTGAVPPSGGGAITPPSGATTTPPGGGAITPPSGGAMPSGGVGTIPPGTTTIPSNNVTALHVYDNSTMVLEFGNGTTLASPYSKVWRISFSPASNQTIGNIPTGAVPPSGGGAITPPSGGGAITPPSGGGAITPPSGGGAITPPSGGGAITPPSGGGG